MNARSQERIRPVRPPLVRVQPMFRFSVTAVLVVLRASLGWLRRRRWWRRQKRAGLRGAAAEVDEPDRFRDQPRQPARQGRSQVEFRVRNDDEAVHDLEVEGPGAAADLGTRSRCVGHPRGRPLGAGRAPGRTAPSATTTRMGWRARSPSPAKAEAPGTSTQHDGGSRLAVLVWIRTSDLRFRRPTLYPTELRARGRIILEPTHRRPGARAAAAERVGFEPTWEA